MLTADHLVGSAVSYAYAVKAGPFVFLNGHEGFDFAAGVVPAIEGPAGFPEFGRPRLRREADFMFQRVGEILKSLGTDFAHSVRLDQYYTQANAVRAYHLARFAALGDTWQDQEHVKFAEEFKQTVKALKKFVEVSNQHTPYLLRKAQRIEEYLNQR